MCRYAILIVVLWVLTLGLLLLLAVLSFLGIVPIELKWILGAAGILLMSLLALLLLFSVGVKLLGRAVAGTINSLLQGVTSKITLEPQTALVWKNPGQVAKLIEQLRQRGFAPIGYYKIAQLPAVQLQAFFHDQEQIFAVISEEILARLVWVDLIAHFAYGSSLTCSNAADDGQAHPPDHPRLTRPKAAVAQLHDLCREHSAGKAPAPISAQDFCRLYQESHARAFAFRAKDKPLLGQTPDDPAGGAAAGNDADEEPPMNTDEHG